MCHEISALTINNPLAGENIGILAQKGRRAPIPGKGGGVDIPAVKFRGQKLR